DTEFARLHQTRQVRHGAGGSIGRCAALDGLTRYASLGSRKAPNRLALAAYAGLVMGNAVIFSNAAPAPQPSKRTTLTHPKALTSPSFPVTSQNRFSRNRLQRIATGQTQLSNSLPHPSLLYRPLPLNPRRQRTDLNHRHQGIAAVGPPVRRGALRKLLIEGLHKALNLLLHRFHLLAHVQDDLHARQVHPQLARQLQNHFQPLQILIRIEPRVPFAARWRQQSFALIQPQRLRMNRILLRNRRNHVCRFILALCHRRSPAAYIAPAMQPYSTYPNARRRSAPAPAPATVF